MKRNIRIVLSVAGIIACTGRLLAIEPLQARINALAKNYGEITRRDPAPQAIACSTDPKASKTGKDAVPVIFDTDMLTDFDDVGTLACLQ